MQEVVPDWLTYIYLLLSISIGVFSYYVVLTVLAYCACRTWNRM